MIEGGKSPQRLDRDITGPRRDPNNRITKPSKPSPSNAAANTARFLSQDDQSRKFVADEDKFVLKQSKKKADIRVREGRAKPADYLAFNLRYIDNDRDVFDDDDGDIEIEVPSPERIVDGSNLAELKELEEGIKSFHTLETSQRNREYWSSLLILCSDRRTKLQGNDHEGRPVSSVSSDVDRILGPKTFEQLEGLEKQIKAKLQSDEQIDTDYWQGLLKNLLVYKAKAKLRKICEAIKESRIEQFRLMNPAKADALASADDESSRAAMTSRGSTSRAPNPPNASSSAAGVTAAASESSDPAPGTARFASSGAQDFSQATRALYEREVARGISENEEIFTAEEAVPSAAKPKWADKYRPRKPQYFNRVQMGYEWNKYNQTHCSYHHSPCGPHLSSFGMSQNASV